MRVLLVGLLMAGQCLVAGIAWGAETQTVVRIPLPSNQAGKALPLPSKMAPAQIIWEAGKVIQIEPNDNASKSRGPQVMMPPMVGELLRVETSIPIAGARASWLAFSNTNISLCAIKQGSSDFVCQRLLVPNMDATRVTVEPRVPMGYYALRYTLRYNDRFSALIDGHLLTMMANAMASAIADTSAALGEYLSKDTLQPANLDAGLCSAGEIHGVAWQQGECDTPDPVLGPGAPEDGPTILRK